jgi:hypothetical protein
MNGGVVALGFRGSHQPHQDHAVNGRERLICPVHDATLWESNTIVRYLAAQYGLGRLWVENPAQRAQGERASDLPSPSTSHPARAAPGFQPTGGQDRTGRRGCRCCAMTKQTQPFGSPTPLCVTSPPSTVLAACGRLQGFSPAPSGSRGERERASDLPSPSTSHPARAAPGFR